MLFATAFSAFPVVFAVYTLGRVSSPSLLPAVRGPYARQAAAAGMAINRVSSVPRRRAPPKTATVVAGS
ncbi:MAG TPA: hypothetical protein VKA51_10525 [Rubrobacteraceae bacterium]|nr:hypothetical protein [Rubrobacteraceae bacterium]